LSLPADGMTPLHIATEEGHNEIAKFLLKHGVSVHQANKSKETVINFHSIKLMSEMIAGGDSSLMIAIDFQQAEMAKLLIEHDANINQLNKCKHAREKKRSVSYF
jgi:ankyrin repeat protein